MSVFCPGGEAAALYYGDPLVVLGLVMFWLVAMMVCGVYILQWIEGNRVSRWKAVVAILFIGVTTGLNVVEFLFHVW